MRCPCCDHDNLPGVDRCGFCQQDMSQQDRPMPHDRVEHALMRQTVAALQPRAAVTLPPQATLAQAMACMAQHDIGAVLVVEAGDTLVGILTERDVLFRGVARETHQRPIAESMTRGPETVRDTDSLALALHKMDCGGYRHLPVLSDRCLVGVISVRDILNYITPICAGSHHGG
ncbi:MAG: CBS domain-containing protein [Gemmataceae bacterium]